MTPEEKAKELVEKMRSVSNPMLLKVTLKDKMAKQYALIAVDEWCKHISTLPFSTIDRLEYWQDVKQEIEKL